MTYTCWESLFKAVAVSQRAEFESSRLSLLREKWLSITSCLPKMSCDCLCLQRLKSCFSTSPNLHPGSICAVFAIFCRSWSWTIPVLVSFLFSNSTQNCCTCCTGYFPTGLLIHFLSIFYPAYKYLCSFISPLFVSSPLIPFLLESIYHLLPFCKPQLQFCLHIFFSVSPLS